AELANTRASNALAPIGLLPEAPLDVTVLAPRVGVLLVCRNSGIEAIAANNSVDSGVNKAANVTIGARSTVHHGQVQRVLIHGFLHPAGRWKSGPTLRPLCLRLGGRRDELRPLSSSHGV